MVVLHLPPPLNHLAHLQRCILTTVPIVDNSILVAAREVLGVLSIPGDRSDGGFMPCNFSLLHLHLFPVVNAGVVVLNRTFLIANGKNSPLVPFKARDASSGPAPGHLLGLDIPEFDVIVRSSQSKQIRSITAEIKHPEYPMLLRWLECVTNVLHGGGDIL